MATGFYYDDRIAAGAGTGTVTDPYGITAAAAAGSAIGHVFYWVYVAGAAATLPLSEKVASAIYDAVNALTVLGAAQTQLAAVYRPTLSGASIVPNHLAAIVTQEDPKPVKPTALGTDTWLHSFTVLVYLRYDLTATMEGSLNQVAADICAALTTTPQWGGLAINTELDSPVFGATPDGAFAVVQVVANVTYRTADNNPYTQA